MSKYKIIEDEGGDLVSIGCSNADSTLDGFIDIYPNDPVVPSLFESIEECRLFAKLIIKILESIS